jgi:hypothetical protein
MSYISRWGLFDAYSHTEWLLFLKEAKEKRNLSQSEVEGLQNRGYTKQEILEMPQDEIDRVLSLEQY